MADKSGKKESFEPLVIFYDSEASNGNVYHGDVIEIAATCHPGVVVGSFERLINTKQKLCSFAINESGITEDKLKGKLFIDEVMGEFLDWIDEMVVLARKKNNTNYFPVLCAHGGYHFDFLILFANLERKGVPYSEFQDSDIHFADSFLFCQKLQHNGNLHLQDTRLSIDGLFHKSFPKHSIKERHRAMGDVKAMVKIFTQSPLKNVLHLLSYSTTGKMVEYFVSQSSSKEQRLILEEKLSSIDPYSRNMNSKRLVRNGLTYDILKTVFQKCSSYMEFWQFLKQAGIDRKVARQFTSQFSAMGLQNQGSLGYVLDAARENSSLSNGSVRDSDGHIKVAVNGNSNGSVRDSDGHTKVAVNGNSNGSVRDSDGHTKVSVNGNSGTNDVTRNSRVLVSKKGNIQSSCSTRNEDSSKGGDVIGATKTIRATNSSRAFEERPLDYAVTSPTDERPKVCATKSRKQQANKNDPCTKINMAKGIDGNYSPKICRSSSIGAPTDTEGTSNAGNCSDSMKRESVPSRNTSTSRNSSVRHSSENWDSELEHSLHRGHFVLQFDEVIPVSITSEDICSSSGGSSTEQRTDMQAKHSNIGNNKESAGGNKRNGDGTVGQDNGNGQTKISKELFVDFDESRRNNKKQESMGNLVNINKTVKKDVSGGKTKAKSTALSSEDREERSMVPSWGNEEFDNKKKLGTLHISDRPNGLHNKTLNSSGGEIGHNKLDNQNDLIRTKRSKKLSSKKLPRSVTFVRPKDSVKHASVNSSSESLHGGLGMATVFVGDVPILVPVEKQSVPCEDRLKLVFSEYKEISTEDSTLSKEDGSAISRKEESTISREEGTSISKQEESTISREQGSSISREEVTTSKNESTKLRNATIGAEDTISSNQREDISKQEENTISREQGSSISREEGTTSKNESTKLRNATIGAEDTISLNQCEDDNSVHDNLDNSKPEIDAIEQCTTNVPPTPVSESISSSSFETSDTGSNLEYRHHASPPPHENESEPGSAPNNIHYIGIEDQASTVEEQSNTDPAAPNTEVHQPCYMRTEDTTTVDGDAEHYYVDNRSEYATEQGGPSVDYSIEINTTQEQLHGIPECPWPNPDVMYSVPPPQYPFHMPYPTGMPPRMFYPTLPHMMPMNSAPRPMHYPSMPFGSQGMVPFVGFPPRFAMHVPMFQPSMYCPVQEDPRPMLGMYEQQFAYETHRSSPEVLGIPDNRMQVHDQQHSKTPGITGTNVSYSTSSDEHSTRSSPFPVDYSSSYTTPLATPHRSPIDDNSPGAQSSSDKGEKSHPSSDRRKSYRKNNKDTRHTRLHKDERGPRRNRISPGKENFPKDNVDLPEKTSGVDQVEALGSNTRESDASMEINKMKESDGMQKKESHSPRQAKESRVKDVKWDCGSHKTPSKSEQLTPPKSDAIEVKTKHDISRLSPRNSRDVHSNHASPHASQTNSRSEQLTPPRRAHKDVSPKTSPSHSKTEQSVSPTKGERSISSDPGTKQQTSSRTSRSDQDSSFSGLKQCSTSSTHNDSHKSQQSNSMDKQSSTEPIESLKSSDLYASPSRTSDVRAHSSTSTNSDRLPQGTSISSKDATQPSLSDVSSPTSSMSVKKNVKHVSPRKEAKPDSPRETSNVITSSVGENKEATHRTTVQHTNYAPRKPEKNVKWPQSALANQKYRDSPKPQREPNYRRRVRESHDSDLGKRMESRTEGFASHGNGEGKGHPRATGFTTASGKVREKEPFSSASGKDLKSKIDDRTQTNYSGHHYSKRSSNYRDVLLGKERETASSIRERGSSTRERRPHPSREEQSSGTSSVKYPPRPTSEAVDNRPSAPHAGNKDTSYGNNYRKEGGKPYKANRPVNETRGSSMSRDSRNNTSNQRNRQYDTNNNGNMQYRNDESKATKS